MREVALVGFADGTREGWRELPATVEIWTVNFAWRYGIERISRLFEMHRVEKLEEDALLSQKRHDELGGQEPFEAQHWAWLQGVRDFPVVMLAEDERIPRSEAYPLGEVELCFGREAFSSSMDYLLALAIYEGYERIYVLGVEMGSETEYAYQRPNFLYWLGQAEGRGVEVVLPEGCGLLPRRRYGYEDYQMVSRQTLEYHLADYKHQLEMAMGMVNKLEGVIEERKRTGDAEGLVKARQEQMQARATMWGIQGAVKAMEHLVTFCDTGEGIGPHEDRMVREASHR
jgi:hypothetical protein